MSAYFLVFALGLLVGVLIGVVIRDAIDLLRSSRKDKPMRKLRELWSGHIVVIAFVLVLVANFGLGVLLVVSRDSATKYATCVAQWQQDFGSAYKARYHSSVQVGNAMDRVLKAVADQDADKFKAAVAHYNGLRDKQITARAKNPLPKLPATVCGPPSGAAR